MKVRYSGAKYSAIVKIGEKLKEIESKENKNILRLNRGVPSVCNIDISDVVPLIDFNSTEFKVYPPNSGLSALKSAINNSYFLGDVGVENLHVTAGGMNALDLVFKTLDVDKVFLPEFYWGAYVNLMKINKVAHDSYNSFDWLLVNVDELENCAVLICDPNNPVGDKYDDKMLLNLAAKLNDKGVVIIWDSPYRKLFFEDDDDFYSRLSRLENVILVESFSKSIGLSGQRIGFVHSKNKEFNSEFSVNQLYENNGVNVFAQMLVEKILTSPQGISAGRNFRAKTIIDMKKNIDLLRSKGLLEANFYTKSEPVGIFAIVNKSEDELLEYNIGSVGLSYFTASSDVDVVNKSRICIAVPHDQFKSFFDGVV